jgi:thioredoxin 1
MQEHEDRQAGRIIWKMAMKSPVSLIGFLAPWCAPCRLQQPILESLSGKYRGRAFIGRLNIESHRPRAGAKGIHYVPTLLLFKSGREVGRLVGLQSEDTLAGALEKLIE